MRTLISKDLCIHRPPWLFAFLTLHAHFSASLLVPVNINSCSWPQNTKPTLRKKYTLHIDHLISQVNITRVFLLNYSFTQCKFYNSLQHFKKVFKMHFLNYILFIYILHYSKTIYWQSISILLKMLMVLVQEVLSKAGTENGIGLQDS